MMGGKRMTRNQMPPPLHTGSFVRAEFGKCWKFRRSFWCRSFRPDEDELMLFPAALHNLTSRETSNLLRQKSADDFNYRGKQIDRPLGRQERPAVDVNTKIKYCRNVCRWTLQMRPVWSANVGAFAGYSNSSSILGFYRWVAKWNVK